MTNDRLARVDPATGAIAVIASGLNTESFAVMDDQTGYIQLQDSGVSPVSHTYRIDLVTGAMTRIENVGFNAPRGLVRDVAGNLLVGHGHVLARIDTAFGSVRPVAVGFEFAIGVATELDGKILVVDYQHQDNFCNPAGGPLTCAGAVYRVDPVTGAMTQVTQNGFFYYPYAVDVFRGPTPPELARAAPAPTTSGSPRRTWGARKR
jgi:hypothetical protein